jgi:hypothetical protein
MEGIETLNFTETEKPILADKTVSKTDKEKEEWNKKVFDISSNVAQESQSKVYDPNIVHKQELAERSANAVMSNSVEDADAIEKLKAMREVFENSNDFFQISKWNNKPNFTEQPEFKEIFSNPQIVIDTLAAEGLPASYASKLSNVRSPEEYEFVIKTAKEEMAVNNHINHSIGTAGKVTGAIAGALTGLDLPLLFVPQYAAFKAGRVAKAVDEMSDIVAIEKMRRSAEADKAIFTAANISASAAVATAQTYLYEDRDAVDGLIAFALMGGVNQFFVNKSFNKLYQSMDETIVTMRATEALSKVDGASIKSTIVGSVDNATEGVVVGASDDIVKGTVTRIRGEMEASAKKIASLEKKLSNTRVGKALRETTSAELAVERASLKTLQTSLNKVRKASTYERAMKEISKVQGLLKVSDDTARVAKDISRVVIDSADEVAKAMPKDELFAIANSVVNKSKGEKLGVKIINGKEVAGKITKDGKFIKFAKQNKLLTAAVVTAMASSSASAMDNGSTSDDMTLSEIGVYGVLAFLGGTVALRTISKAMQNNQGFRAVAGGIVSNMTKTLARSDLAATPNGEKVGKIYAAYNASMTAMGMTFREIYYNGNEAGKKLARDLFYDPENVMTSNADTLKFQMMTDARTKFYPTYRAELEEFKKSIDTKKKSAGDIVRNFGYAEHQFNVLISKAIENPELAVHPSVRKVANNMSSILQSLLREGIEAGVEGLRDLGVTYFTRLTQHRAIYDTAISVDGGFVKGGKFYEAVKANYSKMYAYGNPKASSEAVMNASEEFMNYVKSSATGGRVYDVGEILGSPTARAMERVNLDLDQWKDIDIVIDGLDDVFRFDMMFNRDAENVFSAYVNSMSGHIALAKKNYSSYTEALKIASEQSADVARTAEIGINALIGRQNYDTMNNVAQISKTVSNATIPIMMGMSGIMQIKEVGGTVIRSCKNFSDFKALLDETVNVYRGRGSKDALTAYAMDMDKRGSGIIGNKINQRAFDDSSEHLLANDTSVMSTVQKGSMKARDLFMILNFVAPMTDVAQRLNARFNMNDLAKLVNGKTTMSPRDKARYGIDDEFIAKAQGRMILNKKGNLDVDAAKAIDDLETNEDIRRIVFNMGQTQMVTPMHGTTPAMFKADALGASFGNLMSFAFNAYATYGNNLLKGTVQMDGMTMVDNLLWFGSMYIAQSLKDEAKGIERSEEDKVRMALMMMPLAAPFALPSMIGGSSVQQATAEAMDRATAEQVRGIADLLGAE